MTRNVMFNFLQHLTTSKKQQQLQTPNTDIKSREFTFFGVSKPQKAVTKSKSKHEVGDDDGLDCKAVKRKSKKKSFTKSKFFLRKSRSSNNLSLKLRSTSPDGDVKQEISVSNSSPSHLPASTGGNDGIAEKDCAKYVSNNQITKRSSLCGNVFEPEDFIQSAVQRDSIAKNSSVVATSTNSFATNTNVLQNLPTMTTAPIICQPSQDYLQLPVNLSSNSSSAKSVGSKSSDGLCSDKKRKILSSGQQKKFRRHFKQLPQNEEVLNYFSCAFVSDILLQGFLYITNQHIAFYSNVFGYITKLLIPITSVARISKEKTVKIIPNAIAVATADERHVFSSFLSREAAYQLMVNVWKEALPTYEIHATASAAQLANFSISSKKYTTNSTDIIADPSLSLDEKYTLPKVTNTLQVHQQKRTSNSGLSELEDESSSAISGNETLSKLLQSSHLICNQQVSNDGSSSNSNPSKGDLSANRDSNSELDTSKMFAHDAEPMLSTSNTFSSSNELKFTECNGTPNRRIFAVNIPRTIHVTYFALSVVVILALIAAFLLYRIAEMKNSQFTSFSIDELYKGTPNVDLYADVLKWQKDMQAQRIHLTKNVLASNLEQIAQIGDSLQTLSSLITHSKEDNGHLNQQLTSIMSEYNNLESCVRRENLDQT